MMECGALIARMRAWVRIILRHSPGVVLTRANSGTSAQTPHGDESDGSRSMNAGIEVMIVDDSQTPREMLADFLARDPAIQVVAASSSPLAAHHDFLTQEPDVLLFKVVMPHMSGLNSSQKKW